jgi:hypothetical protein
MRKLSISIGFIGLLAFAIHYYPLPREPAVTQIAEPEARQPAGSIELPQLEQTIEPVTLTAGVQADTGASQDIAPLVADEAEMSARHAELTALIAEYDLYLHDRDKRREIEAQATKVAESYKREVLAKVKSLQ